jgi:hypothetical protein
MYAFFEGRELRVESVPTFFDSTGGSGRSDVPLRNATFTYLVMQWNPRNQPRPSMP